MKSKGIILDLCGGTGSWSNPYKDAGYAVHNITLPEYDVTMNWINDGSITFPKENGGTLTIRLSAIHGILSAPPCTMFSLARTTAKTPRDFKTAMVPVIACLEIIWSARATGGLKWWAMENPTGFLRQFIGNPPYRFEQWQYGGQHKKPTDIWGYFNEPKPIVKKKPILVSSDMMKHWTNPKIPESLKYLGVDGARKALRAMTLQGFAQAFYKANK